MLNWVVWVARWAIILLPIPLYILWRNKRSKYEGAINKLPGRPYLPIFGHALDIVNINPTEMFNFLIEDSHIFGAIYKVWIFAEAQVVVQGARHLEKILKDMTHHTKSEHYSFLHPWMGEGLLTSNDEKWRVHRKVLTPAFHFNILHEFLPIFNKNSLKMCERLEREPEAKSERGFNIFKHSSLCSLDIICESSMGLGINAQENENSPYVLAVNKMADLLVHRYFSPILRSDFIFYFSPTKREMYKVLDYLNGFTDQVIAQRRQYLKSRKQDENNKQNLEDHVGQRKSLSFLDVLLAAESEGSNFMTQKDIRDQVSTFLFEGHDTVSTATSWVLFMLGTHPEIQDRVVAELEEVFGASGRAPDMNDLANLKYLERCVKETLRLFPSVPFFERNIKEDVMLENRLIPGGTNVTVNSYMVHRNPEFWPDPEKFDPDRFLPENSQGRHPYAYIPFSAGPRNCIGQKFALLEEKTVVSTILRRFRVEAAHSLEDVELQINLILRPPKGLHIRVFDRDTHPNLRVKI